MAAESEGFQGGCERFGQFVGGYHRKAGAVFPCTGLFEVDCSVFPAHHAHGGIPSYGKAVPSIISHEGVRIREFPICTKEIGGRHIIFSGGGYFRLFPYWLIRKWAEEKSEYMISYIHPRDLDAGQPMIGELPWSRKFKSYVGLKGADRKLRRLLTDFPFTDLAAADRLVDWTGAPVVEL